VENHDTTEIPTGLALYTRAAERAAREVIYSYSTSFGFATRLLKQPARRHIENIYALVRVADEIVDGSAAEAAALSQAVDPEKALAQFEAETYAAMDSGYSTNLVIHAFAVTAREVGIDRAIVTPFFNSMRADLTAAEHDQASFEAYVYGSAEVVGLMCLDAFCHGHRFSDDEMVRLKLGARALGSAFQKVNFLRDLSADFRKLGRSYFPGVSVETFDEETKMRLVADIAAEVRTACETLPLLPKSARPAVTAALMLFAELNRKISKTPAEELINTRISVSSLRKLALLASAYLGVKP